MVGEKLNQDIKNEPLAELFLIGQFSARLVMSRLLNSKDNEMETARDRGIQILSSIDAPQELIDGFAQLNHSDSDNANQSENTQTTEKRLEKFMALYAEWCEGRTREKGIQSFNLGFCLFMAVFYLNLSQNNSEKFVPPLKENLNAVYNLAQALELEHKGIETALSLFKDGEMKDELSQIAHEITKFFITTLNGLGGEHLIGNTELINW